MQAVHHIGYEGVAADRQGVTELFTNTKVKELIREKGIQLISYNDATKALPRSTTETEVFSAESIRKYLDTVKAHGQDLHCLMILQHGKVVAEKWLGENAPNKSHTMFSVSKTFTANAIGFAVTENRIKVSDKVISFFPDDLPDTISAFLADLEIRDLLTMSVGHDADPTYNIKSNETNWERLFLSTPVVHEPGTKFVYNSLATYMLSAIVQKVTGEKVIDYLYPRLFRPLGIAGAVWETSPSGINNGGWGLYIKTEDMAKMGQFLLQKGNWNGKQLLPESWFDEATSIKIRQGPVWVSPDTKTDDSDWLQGYCYQLWRCRHNAFRADGAEGQFIIVLPEQDAVIVTTANIDDMQAEINLIWEYLLPALK
jgi:CubicO group peptidase (beta-lactamase class C family)